MVCACDLCMCICSQYLHLCVQICKEVRSWHQLAVFLYDYLPYFLKHGLSLNLGIWLDWLTSKPHISASLYHHHPCPTAGVTELCHHAQFLRESWGSKLGSSCCTLLAVPPSQPHQCSKRPNKSTRREQACEGIPAGTVFSLSFPLCTLLETVAMLLLASRMSVWTAFQRLFC